MASMISKARDIRLDNTTPLFFVSNWSMALHDFVSSQMSSLEAENLKIHELIDRSSYKCNCYIKYINFI